nr:uncharacterized protein LOC115255521 [Aedes albopictus]
MDSTVGDCMKCSKSNKICDMVQCDICQSWAHFSCVGVTEAIKDSNWSCDKCSNELQVPKQPKRTANRKGSSKSKSDGGSNQSSVPEGTTGLNEELRKLEAEQRAMEKALEEEMILQKKLQQDRELKQRQLKEERDMLERQLQEEAKYANERKRLHEQFQGAKKAIAESISEEAEGATGGEQLKSDNELSFEKKVQFWLKQQGQGKSGATAKPPCSVIESEECSEVEEDDTPDASEVSEFSTLFLGDSREQSSHSGKGKPKRKEFMHVHNTSSGQPDLPVPPKGTKPCFVCKRTDHKLRFCDDFKKLIAPRNGVASELSILPRLAEVTSFDCNVRAR